VSIIPAAAAAVLLSCACAEAAVTVSAEINRARVSANDQLVLSVTISGDQASLPAPQLPPIQGFSLYESGRSQNLSFINGKMTASIIYTYVLAPRSTGKFKIPPIHAPGAERATDPIDIEVLNEQSPQAVPAPTNPARAAPRAARSPDVFITASLDKTRVFVNQQATLSVRFYYATRLLGDSHYEAPKLSGFLTEDLPPVREGTTEINGRFYHFSEIKSALFPVQAGKLKIGPAAVRCQVARAPGADPFETDFFDRLLSMSAPQSLTLTTEPLTLDVDALPEGKPEDFTGVVGKLSASAEMDHPDAKVGEAATLVVKVSGTGNIKSVPEPKRPNLPSVRFFSSENSANVDRTGDRIGGTKTFRTVLMPRVSGEIRLPPVEFSYFDADTRSYLRAKTASLVLRAAAGTAGSTAGAVLSQAAPGLTDIEADIRYLKTRPETAGISAVLTAWAALGPWHALPATAFLIAAALAWRRRSLDLDPRGRRRREALRRAEDRLRQASALPAEQSARAAAIVDEALAGFVADKLGVAAAGLTLKTSVEGLSSLPKPPSAQTLEKLKDAWGEADLRRFAPGAAGGESALFAGEIARLLKTLEREMRR